MGLKRHIGFAIIMLCAAFAAPAWANDAPAVKKSRNNICHPVSGAFYHKTIHFTPYDSMQACVASGGRPSKR